MKRSLSSIFIFIFLVLLQACAGSGGDSPSRQIVPFTSQGKELHGYLYVPSGDGPFPAVIYNHGSGDNEGEPVDLADFYTSLGFVFFAPARAGQGLSANAGISILQQTETLQAQGLDAAGFQAGVIALHEAANLDVVAAIEWLKTQSFVDTTNMVITGISYGGIQTLLTAEKGLGLRAALAFAPGAISWNPYLAARLETAVQNSQVPTFIIQAENDYSLGPSQDLGPLLMGKGSPNGYKDFPPFGTTHQDGHGKFAASSKGIQIWSPTALDFLKDCGFTILFLREHQEQV